MKRIGTLALLAGLLILGGVATAMAASVEMPESVLMSAKGVKDYTPKKAEVTFNHASHMHIACQDCHHTVPQTYTFQSCMSEGCHDNAKDRTTASSLYNAFHTTKDTSKSCVGCHRDLKKQGQGEAPLACNSCHVK